MDLYGTDLLLTDDGDFAATPAGQLATLSGPLNCAQALISAFRTFPGELPLQPGYGNALGPGIVGTKANDPSLVVSKVNNEVRRIFERDRRFLKAQNIVANTDPANPTRTAVAVELVLAGGDRLTTADLTDSPPLNAFNAQPALADTVDSDELIDVLGFDPDAIDDDIPELAEDLEGDSGDFETGPHA